MKTLHPAGTSMNTTRLGREVFGYQSGAPGSPGMTRTGPMRATPVKFTLVANAPAFVIAVSNPFRSGFQLQNLDPAADLFYNYGIEADVSSFRIAPGGVVLLDFVCPTDSITVFATANLSGIYSDFSRSAE